MKDLYITAVSYIPFTLFFFIHVDIIVKYFSSVYMEITKPTWHTIHESLIYQYLKLHDY